MARTPRPRSFLLVALVSCSSILAVHTAAGAQTVECPRCLADDNDFGYRLHHHYEKVVPVPDKVGQAALGAIQEVVGLLLSDPSTDWSQVSIARLRQHLVDLDEIVLHADVEERPVDGGLVAHVRGDARTLEAVRRVVPIHARHMTGFRGWTTAVSDDGDSFELTLTTDDPEEVAVLRGLGFFGFVSSGVHRPHELLSVARGRPGAEP